MSDPAIQRLRDAHARMKVELHHAIVGQEEVIDQLLIGVLTRGHCLLVGVPGLAKTLLISSLAKTLDLTFNRIQFTPDLMPGDITGTDLLHVDPGTNERTFRFAAGPLFANVVLADEINRTPPKEEARARRRFTASPTRGVRKDGGLPVLAPVPGPRRTASVVVRATTDTTETTERHRYALR